MRLPLPPDIRISGELLRLISAIDEFKGEWQVLEALDAVDQESLRQTAALQSIGASTRIEGSQLSDQQVAKLLASLTPGALRSRDEQEVAGYASVMELMETTWHNLQLTESSLLAIHRDLLRFSTKDEKHRGAWKSVPNHVASFNLEGGEIDFFCETASPSDTPQLMQQTLLWHANEEAEPTLHPLIRIGVFHVVFLGIHPFQDGNGRLARFLTNLMLRRSGYSHTSCSSLESLIEETAHAYYLALRRTQTSFDRSEATDWEPWLRYFLQTIETQIARLRASLPPRKSVKLTRSQAQDVLSPLAEKLKTLLDDKKTLSVGEAAKILHANRNTLKRKFAELVANNLAELHGKGRGAHYRPKHNS